MTRFLLLLPIIALAACQPASDQTADARAGNDMAMTNGMAMGDKGAMTNGMAMGDHGAMGNKMAMTGDQDRDFATMMTEHHKGAIKMARTELEKGKDPAMRALAEKIIADQQREIGQMDAYLAKPAG